MRYLLNICVSAIGTKTEVSLKSGNSFPTGSVLTCARLSSRRIPNWDTGTGPPARADTVIGKGHDGVLLTLVERRTKYALVVKLASKHAPALAIAAIKALRRSGLPVKTITFDNGLEFASHEHIARQLQAVTYFAHPYHSWERGLNENTNGLIRQYIPKNCPISIVRPTDVSWIEDQLNHRPRKSLGYLTPAEFARNELYALEM